MEAGKKLEFGGGKKYFLLTVKYLRNPDIVGRNINVLEILTDRRANINDIKSSFIRRQIRIIKHQISLVSVARIAMKNIAPNFLFCFFLIGKEGEGGKEARVLRTWKYHRDHDRMIKSTSNRDDRRSIS